MREIKFRGKSLEDNGWVYGYYGYKDLTDEHFIIVPTFDNHSPNRPQYFTDNLVHAESVGQYTGLKDKNGVEIYEGDILKGIYDCLGICKFHRSWGSFYFATVYSKNEYDDLVLSSSAVPFWNDSNKFEVIGNIFENKPLLDYE